MYDTRTSQILSQQLPKWDLNSQPVTRNSQLVTRKLGTCHIVYLSNGVQLDQWSLQGSCPFWVAREASRERTRERTVKVRGAMIAWVTPFSCSAHVLFHILPKWRARSHTRSILPYLRWKNKTFSPKKVVLRLLYTIAWFASWLLVTNLYFFLIRNWIFFLSRVFSSVLD